MLERARSVLGGAADAPFADVRGVEIVLDPNEYPRYVQVVSGFALLPQQLASDSAGEDPSGARGSGFLLAAESAQRAPGGIVRVDLELRRALEDQSVDFGQVELSIAGELARIHFEHGLPAARKLLPALARGIVFTPDGRSWSPRASTARSTSSTSLPVPRPGRSFPRATSPRSCRAAGCSWPALPISRHCPLYVFDLASGAVVQELAGHRSAVQALCVAPDGTLLASAGTEGIIKVWDTSQWTCVRRIDCNEEDSESGAILRGVAFSPDGRQIAGFGGQKSGAADWSTPLVRIWKSPAGGSWPSSLPDTPTRCCAGGSPPTARRSTRRARTGRRAPGTWPPVRSCAWIESSRPLYGVGFSPDGESLVLCDDSLRFDTRDVLSDSALLDPAAQLDVSRFAFSPDGRWLATDGGGSIYLWDLSAR